VTLVWEDSCVLSVVSWWHYCQLLTDAANVKLISVNEIVLQCCCTFSFVFLCVCIFSVLFLTQGQFGCPVVSFLLRIFSWSFWVCSSVAAMQLRGKTYLRNRFYAFCRHHIHSGNCLLLFKCHIFHTCKTLLTVPSTVGSRRVPYRYHMPWSDCHGARLAQLFLLLERYVPNVAKRSIWDQCKKYVYWCPTDQQPATDRGLTGDQRPTSEFRRFQMAISPQGVVWSTSCLVLGWGFRGQRIELRYFRIDQFNRPYACKRKMREE